jgi:hypothetical protein
VVRENFLGTYLKIDSVEQNGKGFHATELNNCMVMCMKFNNQLLMHKAGSGEKSFKRKSIGNLQKYMIRKGI